MGGFGFDCCYFRIASLADGLLVLWVHGWCKFLVCWDMVRFSDFVVGLVVIVNLLGLLFKWSG